MALSTIITIGAVILAGYILTQYISKQIMRGLVLAITIITILGCLSHPTDTINYIESVVTRFWPIVKTTVQRGTDGIFGLLYHAVGVKGGK